jgi:hypothetical protein
MVRKLAVLSRWGLLLVALGTQTHLLGATFPVRGDDVTPSLGEFKIVVDPHWADALRANAAYKPYLKNSGGNLNLYCRPAAATPQAKRESPGK